jgi:elongation factor Ts
VLVEVNSETDFVARDENFLSFVNKVVDAAFTSKNKDVATLMAGELETTREALVQKIGENIGVRRIELVNADSGVVGAYVHSNNRIAVLVELKGGDQDLAKDVAMHIAAVNPQVVAAADMPEELVAKEKEIFMAQAQESGKPPEIIEKMIGGRIKKYLAENSLLEQSFVKDPDVTVGKLVSAAGAEAVSFMRFEVGEGIEVEKVDFADEVAAQLNG